MKRELQLITLVVSAAAFSWGCAQPQDAAPDDSAAHSETPVVANAPTATPAPTPPSGDSAVSPQDPPPPPAAAGSPTSIAEIEAQRKALDETTWANETRAQEYEQTIVKYWDQMTNQPSDRKFSVLAAFPMDSINLALERGDDHDLPWGIKRFSLSGEPTTFSSAAWKDFVARLQAQGYQIVSEEWHQGKFDYESPEKARSEFSMTLYVTNEDKSTRWQVQGNMVVDWSDAVDEDGLHLPRQVSLDSLHVLERTGPSAFQTETSFFAGAGERPILAYDLDQDGDSDIVVPVEQKVHWNRGNWQFEESDLFGDAVRIPIAVTASCIADFNNDGYADFLCSGTVRMGDASPSLVLFPGNAEGKFEVDGLIIHDGPIDLPYASCITAGDIDGDGDLDCWVGQYLNPYTSGKPPSPFYDANDGNPAYLFVNNGDGTFNDRTEEAGLGEKRWRRTYAASFIDLDGDVDLDLLTVNDYAGIDVYYNDGTGNFTDVTDTGVDEAANFGMAHTFSDFDLDGQTDFYVTGMSSTTMRRLTHMGLAREDFPEYVDARWQMGYGNRMYMNQGQGRYHQPTFNDRVARTGWTWGCTSLDFDSDGDMDIYVSNGHVTGRSAKDYCSRFWCHDIYVSTPAPSPVLSEFFDQSVLKGLGQDLSWDGFQHNNLLMNLDGADFINVAFMMDVDFVFDSRCAIADDFDLDGKPDLLVTKVTPQGSEAMLVRNVLPEDNHWVGIRLREAPGAPHPLGAQIRVGASSRTYVATVVTGDSYRSQHALLKNVGLGQVDAIDYIEVRWPNGQTTRLENPAVDTYHDIHAL